MTHLITSRDDWTPELLGEIWSHIEDIGHNDLKIDTYPNVFEVVSAEQMLDAYSSTGLKEMYSHWSFGKDFMRNNAKYQKGKMGLALELVINTNPVINYLMEDNNAVAQTLVMAHAGIGHNTVFKNNYLFKERTNASSIIDYVVFAKAFIRDCEEKYGEDEVELILDAAHTLATHSVDKSQRKYKSRVSEAEAKALILKKEDEKQQELDIVIKTTSIVEEKKEKDDTTDMDIEDEENLLYFIYKNAPNMKQWQREICRIICKINAYFYNQKHTKVLNEGMATFTHFYIMDELEKRGLISPDAQLAWLHLHSSVVYQPNMHSKHYDGNFNPYALGFDILKEVRRVCEDPTAEDKEWFPNLVGKDWRTEVKNAAFDYNDESFIEQFMTPNLMRKYKMMTLEIQKGTGSVSEIADDMGYRNMRGAFARQHNSINYTPDIVVSGAKMKSDRTLTLEYKPFLKRSLHRGNAEKTLQYVKLLWGYPVELIVRDERNPEIKTVIMKA